MNNLDSFKTLLEILVLVLTLSTQFPLLGLVTAVFAIYFLLSETYDEDDTGNN
ncbi:MAG: hypothetical protein F6K14_29280 [Symploca sp. SIO2C1]|nr:hypothetical protein [Symploca sp. SIO2C1]